MSLFSTLFGRPEPRDGTQSGESRTTPAGKNPAAGSERAETAAPWLHCPRPDCEIRSACAEPENCAAGLAKDGQP